ncbi:MAG: Fe-S cluster assembly ATPase SufC [Pseudomonadota bacterium]
MLNIKNIHVNVDDKVIIKGLNLNVNAGEVHAIMGPNGSGKSTLAHSLAGRDGFELTKGEIIFDGQDLSSMQTHERARAGCFLGFQYPVEIPGLTTSNFLRHSLNAIRQSREEKALNPIDFIKLLRQKAREIKVTDQMLKRPVNVGFSGGEKKRMEALQLSLLQPKLAIMDETDSGLDIDALKEVAGAINRMRDKTRSIILITHYQRLLNYIQPDFVHVLSDGKIIASGDMKLAHKLENEGYQNIIQTNLES